MPIIDTLTDFIDFLGHRIRNIIFTIYYTRLEISNPVILNVLLFSVNSSCRNLTNKLTDIAKNDGQKDQSNKSSKNNDSKIHAEVENLEQS